MAAMDLQQADIKGRTRITLADGSTKFLRYTYKAVKAFEIKHKEEVGEKINFFTYFQGDEKGLAEKVSATAISILIWAGLLGAGSKFSYDSVCDLLDLKRVGEYLPAIFGAIKGAMGVDDSDVKAEDEDDPLRPTVAPEDIQEL